MNNCRMKPALLLLTAEFPLTLCHAPASWAMPCLSIKAQLASSSVNSCLLVADDAGSAHGLERLAS